MWLRYSRLFVIALFIWAAVLGFRTGSWRIVIAPFLGLGALMLVQTKLRKVFPEFGPKLSTSLVTLIVAYNIYLSVPPLRSWLSSQFPQTSDETERLKRGADLDTAEKLDAAAAELAAREALHTYLLRKEDIVGQQIKSELDRLNAKRQQGTFGPEDEKAEQEVLRQYRKLVEDRKELQRVVTGSPTEVSSPEQLASRSTTNQDSAPRKKLMVSPVQTDERNRSTPLSSEGPTADLPVQRSSIQASQVALNTRLPSQGAVAPAASFDNGYFHITLAKCARSESQVRCSGTTEISTDSPAYKGSDGTVLLVFHKFVVTDENATQYTGSAGSFGDARCMGTGYCWQKITPGIPTSYSFIIDHVDKSATKLNIVMPNNQGENAVLRTVPIQ